MFRMKIMLLIALCLLISACKEEPKIAYDRDKCSLCAMLISNEANSLYMDLGTKHYVYDDLGCLIRQIKDIKDLSKAKIYIKPTISKDFVDIKSVLFTAGNHTPMGYGYFAYLKENLPKDKKALSFDEVKKAILEKIGKQ